MVQEREVLVILFCSVTGENDELLGVDESPITEINWIAIDSTENKKIREGEIYLKAEETKKTTHHHHHIELSDEDDVSSVDDVSTSSGDICASDVSSDDVIYENETESEEEEGQSEKEDDDKIRIGLGEALKQFEDIITELKQDGAIIRLVTENGLHLRQCLHPRAFNQHINLADFFYRYIDLQKEYRAFREKATGFKKLQDIADDMFIKSSEDTLSTPLKKCQFCATVLQHLLKEGHRFTRIEEIKKTLDSGTISGYIKDETIIRARGLPWQVSDVDVADFFVGLNISRSGVALCLNLKGRRNGEALVRFDCQEHRDMALRRHKHHLLGRYIEVYKGTAQDFLKIAKGPAGAMHAAAVFLTNGGEVIVRMRGLPFDAKISDIVNFFGQSPKVYQGEEGVMLVSHPDGSPTGDAFVLFETESEGQVALKKHRENIGKRYVELFRSTRAELQQVLTMYNVGYQLFNPVHGQTYPQVQTVINDRALINQRLQALMNMSCLRMRGLPFSAGQKDILNFLANHADNVVSAVHIIYNLQGRPSGEAFVQMKNPDQAHKCAGDLHLKHMGERYIEVFQCSVQDMTWMLATSHANQLACQHLSQLNHTKTPKTSSSNNTTSPAGAKTTFQPSTPSPPPPPILQTTQAPPMNGILTSPPPPITTNGFFPPEVSQPLPIYTGPFPPMFPPLPQQGFLPPPPPLPPHTSGVPAIPTVMPPMYGDAMQFQMNPFGKPGPMTYIAVNSPEEAHRIIQHEKHMHNKFLPGNAPYVEMFIAH
eukprot:TCONS_00056438-protein